MVNLIVFFLTAVLVWIVVKRKRQRFWFPMLEILQEKSVKPPTFFLQKPPIISFLFFLISAISLFVILQRPQDVVAIEKQNKTQNIHLLFDMSPSVSQPMKEYLAKTEDLLKDLSSFEKFTFSTSHAKDIFTFESKEQVLSLLQSKGFHSGGFRLSKAISFLRVRENIEHVVVVSDRDFYSWMGLEYDESSLNKKIFFHDVSRNILGSNIFIEKVLLLPQENINFDIWEVHLLKSGKDEFRSGKIQGYYNNFEMLSSEWKFTPGQNKQILRLQTSRVEKNVGENFRWEIRSLQKDAILLDNVFYSVAGSDYRRVLIHSSLEGENPFEDPARDLTTVFGSLGFFVSRVDNYTHVAGSFNDIDIFMIADDFSSTESLTDISQVNKELWIAPRYLSSSTKKLCEFIVAAKGLQQALGYGYVCETMKTQEDFNLMLGADGYEQLGGRLGKAQEAFAWQKSDANKEVLIFTVPLKSDSRISMNHSSFPLVVADILRARNMLKDSKIVSTNFSTADITLKWLLANNSRIDLSNVFLEESMLRVKKTLPSQLKLSNDFYESLSFKKVSKDSYRWVIYLLGLVICCLFLEGLFMLVSYRKKVSTGVLVFLLFFLPERKSYGKFELSIVSRKENLFSFVNLSKVLEGRTTISLSNKAQIFPGLSDKVFVNPWIWYLSSKLEKNKASEIIPWIKRGGFLVVESDPDNFISPQEFFKDLAWVGKPAKIGGIHQDHELMKSFYLLKTLPTCNSKPWYSLSFDKRLAVVVIPFSLLARVKDSGASSKCYENHDLEFLQRTFVNLAMVALTTDYKNDQVHVNEILKRIN
jgi:hypothetical protein